MNDPDDFTVVDPGAAVAGEGRSPPRRGPRRRRQCRRPRKSDARAARPNARSSDEDDDGAARQHCRGVADRRRHRHHEHHAGVGHRADARDRHSHAPSARARRDVLRQFLVEAVALERARRRRSASRSAPSHPESIAQILRWSTALSPLSIASSFAVARGGRRLLRLLPGTAGVAPRSDRVAALRVMPHSLRNRAARARPP